MFIRKMLRLIFTLFYTIVLLLSAAYGTSGNTNQQPNLGNTSIPLSTSCPAAGSGRAAVMPVLHLGNHPMIVFFDNTPLSHDSSFMALKRYDVETGKMTTILSKSGENIQTAQLSGDGQWVLFIMQSSNTSAIQLVRIDGKYLQTLYCAPPGQHVDPTNTTGMQWSPDQKLILFTQGPNANSPLPIYLLTPASGNVQLELAASRNQLIQLRTWVDATHVSVTSSPPGFIDLPSTMRMLDTSKGPHQQASDLQLVLGVSDTEWDFASTYDASKLFVVHFDPMSGRAGPGTFCQIFSEPLDGRNGSLIFNSSTLVVSNLRMSGYGLSNLLLRVNQRSSPSDHYNGIWTIKVNGTGLNRLTDVGGPFNQFTQYPWSNVSRDGSLYLDTDFFGPISGGPTTQYTSAGIPVGWTTE